MKKRGYLEGSRMANAFNMLRPSDLIWPYVINVYMKGKAPLPFDLLYWNADSTRMPAANHAFYLRNCYLENKLAQGEMELAGVKLDLKKVKAPIFNLATKEDHIAPWTAAYKTTQLLPGNVRFTLSSSGHIAGIVNPPGAKKYHFWTNERLAPTAEEWFAGAQQQPGSWWEDWHTWIDKQNADAPKVAARNPKQTIEDAPGSYATLRLGHANK